MSRHRTTLKMHRVKDKRATAKLPENEPATSDSPGVAKANVARDRLGTQADDAFTTETLGRYLAAEVSLRESGEERGATALARYFKLTLVMAGLNMLVASASVVMVFSRSNKPQTIVVTPPAPSAAPAVAREPQPASKVVAAPAPPAPALPAVPPPPARIPLLGQPPSPPARIPLLGRPRSAAKRAVAASAPRAPVSVPAPIPSTPVFARNVVDEHPPVPVVNNSTERW